MCLLPLCSCSSSSSCLPALQAAVQTHSTTCCAKPVHVLAPPLLLLLLLPALQAAVKARGWNFCRIDGSMARAEARQAEVERFQTAAGGSKGIPVFLLTTQVRVLTVGLQAGTVGPSRSVCRHMGSCSQHIQVRMCV